MSPWCWLFALPVALFVVGLIAQGVWWWRERRRPY